ncbi:MAG: acylphosphatase [Woeseiaceae bacterium]|nr:acylphosphatase [Woeseiaceae bacterium]
MSGARRFIVRGRVQGVFFRESTRRVAESLSITGHAINQADGSVEVIATGETEALDRLQRWLSEGPPLSRVSSVDAEEIETPATAEFRTG